MSQWTGYPLVVGITGASGALYAARFLRFLAAIDHPCLVTLTQAGEKVAGVELGWELGNPAPALDEEALRSYATRPGWLGLRYVPRDDFRAPILSGSFRTSGMVVIPCSMATLSGIASSRAADVLERAADVTIKEGRPLVLVPRETPLSALHLENMLKLARIGVKILPAMPALYHKPQTIEDLADFVAGRVADVLGLDHNLYERWEGG
ncbi:MAG: UbiX family flavin prenyltransferase [Firmicutes bacterium]|nr:UbiX family flavin prenyltransferase [Bacillota bacterium]